MREKTGEGGGGYLILIFPSFQARFCLVFGSGQWRRKGWEFALKLLTAFTRLRFPETKHSAQTMEEWATVRLIRSS